MSAIDTLAKRWNELERTVFATLSAEDREEVKTVFYAGALAVLQITSNAEDHEQFKRVVWGLMEECNEHTHALIAKHLGQLQA